MSSFIVERPSYIFKPVYPRREDDFEAQILRCASMLFPRYHAAKWKPLIRDKHGHGARPDMVLLSKYYEDWWVVEVELAHHSVSSHIESQLETLNHGIYDSHLVEKLKEAVPQADEESLKHLVYVSPGLLCIANEFVDRISKACRSHCFEYAVVEPYHSDEGEWAVLVQSMPPDIMTPVLTGTYQLRLGNKMGNTVMVTLPNHFPPTIQELEIIYNQGEGRRTFRLFSSGRNRLILLPNELVPESKALHLKMVDPDNRLAELIAE